MPFVKNIGFGEAFIDFLNGTGTSQYQKGE